MMSFKVDGTLSKLNINIVLMGDLKNKIKIHFLGNKKTVIPTN